MAELHVALIADGDDPDHWRAALAPLVPGLTLHAWPQLPAERIDAALVWKPPPGALARLPKLKLIQNLGMGVDALLADPSLPDVPLARLVDDDLIAQMGEYVCWAALNFHRGFAVYARQQRERRWQQRPATDIAACRVGLLGLGAIGADCARKLRALGFPVSGWSRRPKELPGVRCYHGADGLRALLAESRVLVCLLALTPRTRGIVDAALLRRLPRGAYLINVARGGHVVDADLLAALADGALAGAALDVFNDEPLPADSPYWALPNVIVTPHVAGLTRPSAVAAQVADNLLRVRAGRPPRHLVDRAAGY